MLFALVWIQSLLGADSSKGQNRMIIVELPITSSECEKLGLPPTAKEGLTDITANVSQRVCHSLTDSERLKTASWFGVLLDDRFTITRIVKQSGEYYWMLNPKTGSTAEYLCVPITEKLSSKEDGDLGSRSTQLVIALLRSSFDHFDPARQPFQIAGLPASEYADFTEQEGSVARNKWKNSQLVFTSVGGDALLVSGGNAAWYQLETNSVIPCGTFKQAIERYFKSIASDREFSSWNDVKAQ